MIPYSLIVIQNSTSLHPLKLSARPSCSQVVPDKFSSRGGQAPLQPVELHTHQPYRNAQHSNQDVLHSSTVVPHPAAASNSPPASQLAGGSTSHGAPRRCPSSSSSSSSSSSCAAGCDGKVDTSSNCSSGTDSTHTGNNHSVVVTVLDTPSSSDGGALMSIYDLYTPRRMYAIMLVVALAAVTAPLSNTIFFPAMKAIQTDLHTTAAAVTSSVATFQIAIGLGALLWGPASDKYGRKPILLMATVLFALSNVPLILAPNIGVLIAFRTLQGAAVAAYASAGPGLTADICSPCNRGTLFGICSVAALVGPVMGPPLGGGLSQAFGWRSMFVLLVALSTVVILPLLVWFVPETLQYKVMQQLSRAQPAAASKVAEAQSILAQGPPQFQAPWSPLLILCDRQLVLHVGTILLGYGTYLCSLAVLPFYLAHAPYSLSPGAIGAAYLPGALAAILASPCGGKLADIAGRANPQQPLRRLVYAVSLHLMLVPLSVVLLGWGLQSGWHLAVPLLASFMVSFVNCLYMPGLFTVLTIVKQGASAAAVGGVYALLFLLSGSLMMVGTAVVISLGLGPFLTILAMLHLACTLAAFVQIILCCSSTPLPQPLVSRQGSTAFMRSAYHIMATSFKDPNSAGPAGDDRRPHEVPAGGGGCKGAAGTCC